MFQQKIDELETHKDKQTMSLGVKENTYNTSL